MRNVPYNTVFVATFVLTAGLALPVISQEAGSQTSAKGFVLEEVYVTAQRREERIQDVPISLAVFSQEQLDDANIANAGDLANYVPSLQVNTRFGGDTTTFAVRGFGQELRTTATVGVYFAEVVAPRGANTQNSGDGAGPGDFFDLQNVQVLKGPQGTLFGRNSTGGAILLTPQRPTEELEGYIEGSAGNYDMWRTQGVINSPVGDSVRLRLAVDHQERDGYLKNFSGIGPSDFANLDYTAVRASMVVDVTDTLENYTILRYTTSDNNGYPGSVFSCGPGVFGAIPGFCDADLANRKATGNDDFYDVYSFVPDPVSEQDLAQLINTTSWEVNDNFIVKNILSYAEFETKNRSALFGTDWNWTLSPAPQPFQFQMVGTNPDYPTTDQSTFVEELQFQGTSLEERLEWQAGLYYEKSEPDGDYGAQSPAIISCDLSTTGSSNPADFRCNDFLGVLQGMSVGSVQSTRGGVTYENAAVYAQGTYDLTDEWDVTAGVRYTDDKTTGKVTDTVNYFPGVLDGGYFPSNGQLVEYRTPESQSSEPTWLLGTAYHPTNDMMLYAKYARGYRQGSVNNGGTTGFDTHDPETIDSYEIGAKTSFFGKFPGTFNVALFYNDLQDQQIQFGYFKFSGVGTTAIVNAGGSTIWGMEADGDIHLTDNLLLGASYTYLDTNVDKIIFPDIPSPQEVSTTTAEGEPLPYSPENKFAVTASYLLPVDPQWGDMRASATYAWVDDMQAVSEAASALATLPSYGLLNLNFDWAGVGGKPIDLSIFATNVTDEEYITSISGTYVNGVETGQVGVPRMYGVRVRYNFGG